MKATSQPARAADLTALPRPPTVGLTGAVAAGKSEALGALGRLGAATISSDAIVHELLGTEEVRRRLVERWGRDVAPNQEVDRRRVGEIVFADPAELAWLEGVLHPLVGARIAEWLRDVPSGAPAAVVEAPLLFEGGLAATFDTTIAVISSEEVRRERASARGHALVEERESRQLSQEEKAARAEHVVRNDGSIEDLERALASILATLGEAIPGTRPESLPS